MTTNVPVDYLPRKNKFYRLYLPVGLIILAVLLLILGVLWWRNASAQPAQAPEADIVLQAQQEMPFQVLIPAYLPKRFARESVQVITDQLGPEGQPIIQLIYPAPGGENLTFYEWLPAEGDIQPTGTTGKCMCMAQVNIVPVETSLTGSSLRIRGVVSNPTIMSSEEARTALDTLGPATNQQIFTSLDEVPVAYSLSPAVDIPVNAQGVQEVTLVINPNGYTPEHFAVKKDIPVRLTFRQLGQVGCGNELIFEWGKGESETLYLASPGDVQVFEFTPGQTGEFAFNCPHYIYRGAITVQE
jgi:hypothetical protein